MGKIPENCDAPRDKIKKKAEAKKKKKESVRKSKDMREEVKNLADQKKKSQIVQTGTHIEQEAKKGKCSEKTSSSGYNRE